MGWYGNEFTGSDTVSPSIVVNSPLVTVTGLGPSDQMVAQVGPGVFTAQRRNVISRTPVTGAPYSVRRPW